MIQDFQGTAFETLLKTEEAEILSWGDDFDAKAEFRDVLAKLEDAIRKKQLQALLAKPGGMLALNEQERELFRQLSQPSRPAGKF